MRQRLDPSIFDLSVQEIRRGYRSAVYFWRTKRILERDNYHPRVTHQIFQKNKNVVICGTDEAIGILRSATGYYSDPERAFKLFDRYIEIKQMIRKVLHNGNYDTYIEMTAAKTEIARRLDSLWVDCFSEISVHSLYDGDSLGAWESAMLIEGDYSLFAHLESLYLGVLARRTKVATNTRAIVDAARTKQVLFFADRFDHFSTQGGDGYAAKIGGAGGVATDAMAAWYGEQGLGTIPHAIIAVYNADTVKAIEKFNQYYPAVPAIALVDFENDCVKTSLECARAMGEKLWGVRLDTAETMVDIRMSQDSNLKDEERYGVVPGLVSKVREALDREGFKHVKIIVSGGFTPTRIEKFESAGTPVDIYAVGSWILSGRYDFTADVVRVDGRPMAKVGRAYHPNPRLEKVEIV